MRRRVIMICALVAALATAAAALPKAYAHVVDSGPKAAAAAARAASQSMDMAIQAAAPPPTLAAGPVNVSTPGYWSWALLDRRTTELSGSPNFATTNSTESMIKAWIVSDFLRRTAEANKKPTEQRLKQASTAIRDSNDDSAQALWVAGGRAEVIARLIKMCGLTDTKANPGYWSLTQMSARDAVRMGLCIADGRAAGPQWTEWVLKEMRSVRGDIKTQALKSGGGRWGIIEGLPAEAVPMTAIKNGWTAHTGNLVGDNNWHLNCLAIGEDFVLAVGARYPVSLGLEHGAAICRTITQQLAQNALDG